jgi:transposase-like protein
VSDEEQREEKDGAVRGRPGRRSVEERTEAVLALLAGKATVDQLALKYGVRKETIEAWRTEAVAGVEAALRHGGKSDRERELEKELEVAKSALTRAVMQKELMENMMKLRGPSGPTRSRK